MGQVKVVNHVTLDGVMQSPAGAEEAVARLKEDGPNLVVLGSGELIGSLLRHDLIDEFQLMIHPVVLGSGRRLFADGGAFADLRLTDTVTTTTGVIIATYRRSGK